MGGAGPGGRSSNGGSSGSPAAAEPKTPSPKGSAAAAAGGSADGSAAAAGADGEEEAQPSRKLLLLWFHTNSFEWRLEDEVLPFLAHKQEFKGMRAESLSCGQECSKYVFRELLSVNRPCSHPAGMVLQVQHSCTCTHPSPERVQTHTRLQEMPRLYHCGLQTYMHTQLLPHFSDPSVLLPLSLPPVLSHCRLAEHCLWFTPTAAAQALIEAGRLPRHQDWKRAYREAKHCHTIVARAAKLRSRQQQMGLLGGPAAAAMAAAHLSSDEEGAGSSDSEGECDHRAAVAGRAAKQALAVNMKMPR